MGSILAIIATGCEKSECQCPVYQSAERRWKSAPAADFHNFIILMHWQDHCISFKTYFMRNAHCAYMHSISIDTQQMPVSSAVDQSAKRWKSAAAADFHKPFISSIITFPSRCSSSKVNRGTAMISIVASAFHFQDIRAAAARSWV